MQIVYLRITTGFRIFIVCIRIINGLRPGVSTDNPEALFVFFPGLHEKLLVTFVLIEITVTRRY